MSKFLLICHDLPSFDVGATLPMYHLCKHLSRENDVYLFYLDNNMRQSDILDYVYYNDCFKINFHKSTLSQIMHVLKNTFSYYDYREKEDPFFYYYYYPEVHEKIQALLNNKKIDVIITDAPMAFFVKYVKKPKIVYALDAISEYYRMNYLFSNVSLKKFIYYMQYKNFFRYERSIYNRFDFCIVVTERDKEILKENVDTPICVVPNGVDSKYFSPCNNQVNNHLITFVGDMGSTPNIDAIWFFYKEVFLKLQKRLPDIRLNIVGRNPGKGILELGKDPNIQVTGFVEDVRPYISISSIIISPMISGMGIKNKILEAMSMGKTVITTGIGAEGISINDGVNGFIAKNSDEFIDKIIFLLNNPEFKIEIEKNARITILKKYNWEHYLDRIVAIIKRINK